MSTARERAERSIGREAEAYLETVATFAEYGRDPHAAARSRARIARFREAAAAGEATPPKPTRRARLHARQLSNMERKREQGRALLRFVPCPDHDHRTPCPSDCLHYRARCSAADLDPDE